MTSLYGICGLPPPPPPPPIQKSWICLCDIVTVRNQQQLLTRKTLEWHSLLFLKTKFSNYHQKLNEKQYLKHFYVQKL